MILFLRNAPLCTYDFDFAELEEERARLKRGMSRKIV